MILYQVEYPDIDWNAYFCGSNKYHVRSTRLFTTRAKAEEFVAGTLQEYVPDWKSTSLSKEQEKDSSPRFVQNDEGQIKGLIWQTSLLRPRMPNSLKAILGATASGASVMALEKIVLVKSLCGSEQKCDVNYEEG